MEAWQVKAHRIIGELSRQSYEQANRMRSGKLRKKHAAYSVPYAAQELIRALNINDEHMAKSIMMHDYDVQQAWQNLQGRGRKTSHRESR
jgi:hypothetical protein